MRNSDGFLRHSVMVTSVSSITLSESSSASFSSFAVNSSHLFLTYLLPSFTVSVGEAAPLFQVYQELLARRQHCLGLVNFGILLRYLDSLLHQLVVQLVLLIAWYNSRHTALMASVPLHLAHHTTHVVLDLGCTR